MAFLSLPHELLLHIYTQVPTLDDAAHLFSVNRRLHSVWLENDTRIANAILRPLIPSYEDAVELAILEETVIDNTQPSSLVKSKVPVRSYIRRLLHNASLASGATAAWNRWLASLPTDNLRSGRNYSSLHESYYLMRKILLAHNHPEARLHQALYWNLRTASFDILVMHADFNIFLSGHFDANVESERHGIFKSKEDWTKEEKLGYERGLYVVVEGWQHVENVLHAAMQEKVYGYQNLRTQLFNGRQEQTSRPAS